RLLGEARNARAAPRVRQTGADRDLQGGPERRPDHHLGEPRRVAAGEEDRRGAVQLRDHLVAVCVLAGLEREDLGRDPERAVVLETLVGPPVVRRLTLVRGRRRAHEHGAVGGPGPREQPPFDGLGPRVELAGAEEPERDLAHVRSSPGRKASIDICFHHRSGPTASRIASTWLTWALIAFTLSARMSSGSS